MKQHLNTVIIAAAVVITALFFTQTYKNRNRSNDLISVTGLGSKDFKSDLIIWRGAISVNNLDLKLATAAFVLSALALTRLRYRRRASLAGAR